MARTSKKGGLFLSVKRKKHYINLGLLKWRQEQIRRKAVTAGLTSENSNSATDVIATSEDIHHVGPSNGVICHDVDPTNQLDPAELSQPTSHNEKAREANGSNQSFNTLEIACSSTPFTIPNPEQVEHKTVNVTKTSRRKLVMEEVTGEMSFLNAPSCSYSDEPMPLVEEQPVTITEDYLDGVPKTHVIHGRRIVDFESLLIRIKEISDHNPTMGCTISNCYIISETCFGMKSKITMKCNMCSVELPLVTDKTNNESMDINTASVAGAMAIGIGYSQLQELLSSMEIPFMSTNTYSKYHDSVAEAWEETALEEMTASAAEETQHAIKEGRVSADGTPILTVVADGSWSKRSYRTNFNSLAGVAAIVGYHTKKVIFLGVRNKYCTICARAAKTESKPPKHACFKNWSGSSSKMESDIILEGFSRSLEMYGVMYGTILADGDSSVYSTLLESRPYPNLTIEKVECTNHLIRNYCNKLRDITVNTKLGEVGLRRVVKNNIMRLRTAVTKAVEYRKCEDGIQENERIENLRKDITNSASHVFGEHLRCKDLKYFCAGQKEGEKNYVPELKETGIYQQMMKHIGLLADNSRSLIMKVTNNPAEHYNSIIAKYVGGKRVNFAVKRLYKARCLAAVVSHNTRLPLYRLHKHMYQRSPGKVMKRQQSARAKAMENKALRRKNNPNKRQKIIRNVRNKNEDAKHYGYNAQKPDIAANEYEKKSNEFLSNLRRSEYDRKQLERGTLLQAGSGLWKEERRKLLTASNFGIVCKRRNTTSCENLVKRLLYSDFDCMSMKYGREHETQAIKDFEEQTGLDVEKCGLFVDKELPYLGATPDGLVGLDSVLEVKCPATCKHVTPEDGILTKKFTFWNVSNGKSDIEDINKQHHYFYQVQGQLHVTQRQFCFFVMWTPLGIRISKIERDDSFWKKEMEEKLRMFYMDCMLPELVDPRQSRSMPIRNPPYITEAIKLLNKKKTLRMTKTPKVDASEESK